MIEKQFPILSKSKEKEYIPWITIKVYEQRAMRNHGGQTLTRLAERGGLSWCEVLQIFENRGWGTITIDEDEARQKVLKIISKRCIKCGCVLRLGGFSYNQNTCWECFKREVQIIKKQIDQYPSWLKDERESHKAVLDYLVDCLAERVGEMK